MSSTPTSAPAAVTFTDIQINRCWSKIKIERASVADLEQQFSGSFGAAAWSLNQAAAFQHA